jgi:hypothetical protein
MVEWTRRRMVRGSLRLLPPGTAVRYVAAGNAASWHRVLPLPIVAYLGVVVPAFVIEWDSAHRLTGWTLAYVDLAIPLGMAVLYVLARLLNRPRVIAVTDDAVALLESHSYFRWTPARVIGTFPRTQLGPVRRARVTVGGQRLRVYQPWSDEIRAADWDLFTRRAEPAGDHPVSEDGRWWWDGSGWRPVPAPAPVGAGLSLDGRAWWDGAAWRVRPTGLSTGI